MTETIVSTFVCVDKFESKNQHQENKIVNNTLVSPHKELTAFQTFVGASVGMSPTHD